MRKLLIFFGLVLILTACGGRSETAVSPKADEIVCTAAYRSSVEVGIEQEDTFTFTDVDDELSATFGELMFHAAYDAGGADNERSLRLWVTDAEETAVLHSNLYQMQQNSGPQNQFVGGHGFTGLNYSYAPEATAELQYWCEAKSVSVTRLHSKQVG